MNRALAAALAVVAALAMGAATAAAQTSDLTSRCPSVPAQARDVCYAAAQAAGSAQPQLGVLIAAGNPTIGTAGASGLTIPFLPRISATAKANLVFVRLPDLLARELGAPAAAANRMLGVPAPALQGAASVELFPGVDLLPGVGGLGAVDVLGSAAWLPFRTFSVRGFEDGRQKPSYGLGARVGLLREGFAVPGATVSLVRYRTGRIGFGDVCPDGEVPTAPPGGACPRPGTLGEFDFDLTTWSTRAVVSKRLFGIGLAGGVGHDRNQSDVAFGFRYQDAGLQRVVRVSDVPLRESRWNGFVNGSFTFLLASVAAEAGWMQGGEAVAGFDEAASRFDPTRGTFFGFDPTRGTFFGSVGVRLSF